mmetsp:Transcript_36634/g.96701  ORF Transcript_36634/g.96701 Transcript_36634/m.96701 type:complete len:124 (+) Transcript_36634:647-1018(+)
MWRVCRRGPRLGGVNLRKSVALSQIRLATRFPAPSVLAVLPDLCGRTHAPSVGAAVKKFRASAKALAWKACSKMDLRSDEERDARREQDQEEQWTVQHRLAGQSSGVKFDRDAVKRASWRASR